MSGRRHLNGKLHQRDNLYVVDAGLLISSTAVNPTLTIIANVRRVAEHLVDRLRSLPTHERPPMPSNSRALPRPQRPDGWDAPAVPVSVSSPSGRLSG